MAGCLFLASSHLWADTILANGYCRHSTPAKLANSLSLSLYVTHHCTTHTFSYRRTLLLRAVILGAPLPPPRMTDTALEQVMYLLPILGLPRNFSLDEQHAQLFNKVHILSHTLAHSLSHALCLCLFLSLCLSLFLFLSLSFSLSLSQPASQCAGSNVCVAVCVAACVAVCVAVCVAA